MGEERITRKGNTTTGEEREIWGGAAQNTFRMEGERG